MITPHLTVVVHQGAIKIAQFGDRDGGPSGAGLKILDFLRHRFDQDVFVAGLAHARRANVDDVAALYQAVGASEVEADTGWLADDKATALEALAPALSNALGVGVLDMVQNSTAPFLVFNDISNAQDVDWAYVVDLDRGVFQTHAYRDNGAHAARRFAHQPSLALVAEWRLDNLPRESVFSLAYMPPHPHR